MIDALKENKQLRIDVGCLIKENAELKAALAATRTSNDTHCTKNLELSAHIGRLRERLVSSNEILDWTDKHGTHPNIELDALVDSNNSFLNETPKQSLAHIQANAIEKMLNEIDMINGYITEGDVESYAEQLRGK